MASVGEFLVAWVKTQADLTALLGGESALRVSPASAVRKDGLPRIVYLKIWNETIKTLARPTSLRKSVYQLEAQAATNQQVQAIIEMLLGDPDGGDMRLDGYAGTLGGIKVQCCRHDSDADDLNEATSQPDRAGVFSAIAQFEIWWNKV